MSISGQAVLPLATISAGTVAAAPDGGPAPDAGAALLALAVAEAQVQDEPAVVFSAVVNADGTLPDGTPAHAQDVACLAEWKERFERSGRALRRLHVYINPALEARFEAARTVLTALGRPAKDELLLFHGTPAANFESILERGLHVGGTNGVEIATGCASGVGIYMTESAEGAIGYTKGADRIFACRVLPGLVTKDVEKVRKIPSTAVGKERFDSFFGPYGKSSIYVVRCADLVLPSCMVEFEPTPRPAPASKAAAKAPATVRKAAVKPRKAAHSTRKTSAVKALAEPLKLTKTRAATKKPSESLRASSSARPAPMPLTRSRKALAQSRVSLPQTPLDRHHCPTILLQFTNMAWFFRDSGVLN